MSGQEHAIDRALRALAAEVDEADRPNEDTILAYLAGRATELEMREVRAAVLASPGFRDSVLSLAEEMKELDSDEIARAFDGVDPGSAPSLDSALGPHGPVDPPRGDTRAAPDRSPRASWLDSLFRRPALAFAFAALLLVVAVPLLRPRPGVVLSGRPSDGAPVLTIRALPAGDLRGDEAFRFPEAPLAGRELVLRLEAPPGTEPGDTARVTVSDSTGEVWRGDDPHAFERIDADVFLVLAVSPGRLEPGPVNVHLLDQDGNALARYRFQLRER